MRQPKVTRKELREMHVGETRIILLEKPTSIDSARVTCMQLKNLQEGEWMMKPDFKQCGVSITRIK